MELFRLFGTIAINSTGAKEAIDDVDNKAKGLSDKLQTVGGKVTSFGNKLSKKITAPAVAAGGAIMAFASKSASAGDKIDKMSQKIGISRQAYQELDFICSQSGTSVDTLQMGMKTLTAAMTGAANGTKSNVAQFEKLGVSVTDANGKLRKQEDVMFDAMAAMQKMDNQTEKARLATELFGRSGSELMPLLNGASGSIEEMKQKAHDLGLVISDEAVDSSVVFSDTMDQLKRSLSAAALKAGTALLPIITEIAQAFIEKGVPAIQKFSEKVQAAIKWFDSLNSGTKKVIATIAALVVGIGPALSITGKMISTVGKMINVGKVLITVLTGFNPVLLAIVAGVTAVIAIGVSLYKNWDTIKAKAKGLLSGIKSAWNEIKSITEKVFGHVFDVISNKIQAAKNVVEKAVGGIKKAVSAVGDFLGGGNSKTSPKTTKKTANVKAHASGAILKKPTVFGYTPATNTYHLGGEAGAEAVAPIETLMGYVRTAVAEQNEGIMSEIKSLLEKLLQTVQQGQGDTIIPVYIGNDKIDEIIMTAKQRITNRSGGFANV